MGDEAVEIKRGLKIPLSEISFRTSRSDGPGGQHVNKTETRVELLFDVVGSPTLSQEQKSRIRARLSSSLDRDGVLHIVNQQTRSQWKNKQHAIERFHVLLRNALRPVKPRIKTARTQKSIERRLQTKRLRGERKRQRTSRHRSEEDAG